MRATGKAHAAPIPPLATARVSPLPLLVSLSRWYVTKKKNGPREVHELYLGNRPKSPAGEKENNKPRQWGGEGKKTANQALKLGFEKLPGSKKYVGFGL
jgi:hypothetical protein